MRLIVTGGLGFISSNFINYWHKHYPEDSILNIDSVTYAADFRNISVEHNEMYDFLKTDINDFETLVSLAGDYETIVNFAAESHVDSSIANS